MVVMRADDGKIEFVSAEDVAGDARDALGGDGVDALDILFERAHTTELEE